MECAELGLRLTNCGFNLEVFTFDDLKNLATLGHGMISFEF